MEKKIEKQVSLELKYAEHWNKEMQKTANRYKKVVKKKREQIKKDSSDAKHQNQHTQERRGD